MNRKKLDDFVNLLNLNPDRYVSTVVGKGEEPNTLGVNYGIYEANPWHYFIQVITPEWRTAGGVRLSAL